MSTYLVKAPYVTLQVKDTNGATVLQGYYEGAVVQDPVKGESLDKHIRTEMVVEAGADAAFGAGGKPDESASKSADSKTRR